MSRTPSVAVLDGVPGDRAESAAEALVLVLVGDDIPRVRVAAVRVLEDPEPAVWDAAQRGRQRWADRLDRPL